MAWSEGLEPGQRSMTWLEPLNVGTLPEKPWQWSEADVVFSAAYDDNTSAASSGSSSESSCEQLESPGSGTRTPLSPAQETPTERTTALVVRSFHQGWDRTFELDYGWPRPRIAKPSEVLIRTRAVGLNPVDFKSIIYRFGIASLPWVLGRDVAGVVEEVGSDVRHLAVGDRVWTCADSRHVRAGAYQVHCAAEAATVGKIPDSISDDAAATLGTGLVTAAIALWWFFKIPFPSQSATRRQSADDLEDWLIVYGGGAITGIFAAQLAALSGIRVLAVASPSNFDHLRSYGVAACVDRFGTPEEIQQQIVDITQGRVAPSEGAAAKRGRARYALDCVGSMTAAVCLHALLSSETADTQAKNDRIQRSFIGLAGNPKEPVPEGSGIQIHRISFSTTFYGDAAWSQQVLAEMEALMTSGKLQPARVELIGDGLAGIRKGLELLKDGKAPTAKKLVVRVEDTPAAAVTNLGVRCELGWNGH